MSSLKKFLKEKGFKRIKLKYTKTQHLELVAKINNIEGNFILDTGASSTCVGLEAVEHFKLLAEDSDIKAAGAGATNMLTQIAQKNRIEIKGWKKKKVDLVLFDLRHVNEALINHEAEKVHGIIGADILKKGKAVIDYKTPSLYLK
ncbi:MULTISPECIES: retropepsin-like aspartic protease [Salegentibacter]|jgi:predicted aspartyl protease|uniref:Aspartyl protease n=2 Tax=Salegentibacter TaxID=143222 RepID=A0A1I2PW44_9FLAO|nr:MULTISPECIES: retropepsin-like aspartic protease [Salegentibacter]APS37866.1 acid protease [Salegentibacter sp. T436]SFG20268.1 Aspartyl protease [Salegentibacter agarivorans]